jgi:hypothetical protein
VSSTVAGAAGATTPLAAGTATAVALARDYTGSPVWKGAGRVEYRFSDVENSRLSTLAVTRRLTDDWSLIVRNVSLSSHAPVVESAAGRAEPQRLPEHIAHLLSFDSLTITGHADVTGKPAQNLLLSQRRAATVAAELAVDGVDATKITAVGVGSAEPIAVCDKALRHQHRSQYLACLEPDRRVTLDLVGTAAPLTAVGTARAGGKRLPGAPPSPTKRVAGGPFSAFFRDFTGD